MNHLQFTEFGRNRVILVANQNLLGPRITMEVLSLALQHNEDQMYFPDVEALNIVARIAPNLHNLICESVEKRYLKRAGWIRRGMFNNIRHLHPSDRTQVLSLICLRAYMAPGWDVKYSKVNLRSLYRYYQWTKSLKWRYPNFVGINL